MTLLVDIYRSAKHEGMYLYVKRGAELTSLPEPLMTRFGQAQHAMVLPLSAEKKLAVADVLHVIACIKEQGFYLQMPPRSYVSPIPNDKLPTH